MKNLNKDSTAEEKTNGGQTEDQNPKKPKKTYFRYGLSYDNDAGKTDDNSKKPEPYNKYGNEFPTKKGGKFLDYDELCQYLQHKYGSAIPKNIFSNKFWKNSSLWNKPEIEGLGSDDGLETTKDSTHKISKSDFQLNEPVTLQNQTDDYYKDLADKEILSVDSSVTWQICKQDYNGSDIIVCTTGYDLDKFMDVYNKIVTDNKNG